MFEYFIAKRYLRSKHRLNFISIISVLSTVGVTIGVAAIVIVLSVFNGFGSLVTTMLINFDPHVRITGINLENYPYAIDYIENSDQVQSYSKFAQGKIILINNSTVEILNIKGIPIDNEESTSRVEQRVNFGSFDISDKDDNISGIILSLPIALRLSVRTGDTVFATSASQIRNTITRLSIPHTKRFVVTGIYEISNKEYALEYCFTSFSSAQKMLNMRDKITGIEIILKDLDYSESFKQGILKKFSGYNLNVSTWYDLHKDLYRVMLIERWAAYILLSLIIAVAAFNILSSLTMSVLEKKKDIGILRSMGTTALSIKKIFMFEGVLIGFIGTILGLLIGLAVCYIQINFNIYSLDASKYVIDTLPVQVKAGDIIAVSLISFLLTFFASKYPANRALRVKLIEAIKWE